MRDAIFGQNQPRGSVPNVRAPGIGGRPVWNSGEAMQQTQGSGTGARAIWSGVLWPARYTVSLMARQPVGGGGGSFLGTAAAAAAGVVGGSLLLGSIRSMMGGGAPAGLRQYRRHSTTSAGREAINPAATWRGMPESTTSVHPEIRAPGCSITIITTTVHAPDCSTARRTTTTTTTWIMIPTASKMTATAITPDQIQPEKKRRPLDRAAACFRIEIVILTRFLYANRQPLRSKTL